MADEEVMEKPTADNAPETETIPEEGQEPVAESTEEKVPVEEEEKPEEPVKKNHDQRRWERLLNERAEYKAKVELYEKQQQSQSQQNQPDSGRPAREKFASDEDYVDALTDWKIGQKLGPMQEKIAQQQQQAQIESAWDSKLAVAKTEYPDFDQVLQDSNDVPVTPTMAQAIKSSDMGADLVYFLGKDPEYAMKIARMDPLSAARELGKIESYIEYEKNQKKSKPKPTVSKAPAPIKPVKASSAAGVKSIEDMSPAEYIAYRNKQSGKR